MATLIQVPQSACHQNQSCSSHGHTLAFFPEQVKMPTSSNLELLTAAAQDLMQALQNLEESSPLHPLSASQSQALKDLNALLGDTLPTAPKMLPTLHQL